MYLSRQTRPEPGNRTLGLAYFIWLVGGFLGLHRIYLKNYLGMLYWPLFGAILFASSMQQDARVTYSNALASVVAIDKSLVRSSKRIDKSSVAIDGAQAQLVELPVGDSGRKRLERKIEKQQKRRDDARLKISELETERVRVEPTINVAKYERHWWSKMALYCFFAIVAFMALDFLLIPGLVQKARAYLRDNPDDEVTRELLADDSKAVSQGWTGYIDRISLFCGEFVAFWSVIAVFVYYYEVIVRYMFNSPTNWAHEGMFLMFGMQYLIAGSYAMLTESHVRVDIFYAKFSPRGKAIIDLLTSIFFFIFAGTLLVTGWIFAGDALRQGEVSFTEWAIQYWPVKILIVIGSLLLLLQGVSKLAKDFSLVITPPKKA